VVGEEGQQRVERRLGAPRRHPPHQIHRRLHPRRLLGSLSASSASSLVLVLIQFLCVLFIFRFVCLLLFFSYLFLALFVLCIRDT
jgi:hypothetical protein